MQNINITKMVIVFFTIIYVVDAGCSFNHKCVDNVSGKRYKVGRRWIERYETYCNLCYCFSSGASCCDTGRITSYPDHCFDIFDDKRCVHHVVEKSDPCQPCSGPLAGVGK